MASEAHFERDSNTFHISNEEEKVSFTSSDRVTSGKETGVEGSDRHDATVRCHINWATVPLKLIYFIFNGGMILVWPFIPNYLISLGRKESVGSSVRNHTFSHKIT